MTRDEAFTFLAEWQQSHPKCDYMVRDNGQWRTTREGDAAIKLLCKPRYDLETFRDMAAEATVKSVYRVQLPHVFKYYDEHSAPQKSEDNPYLTSLGHGTFVEMDDGQSYGVVDLDCTDPGIWVLQPRKNPVSGEDEKPEWTYMGQQRVRQNMATPVGGDDAQRIRNRWWKMEQEGQFHSEGPWKFYRPWTPPLPSIKEYRAAFMALCRRAQPKHGERVEAQTVDAVMTPGMAEIERQLGRRPDIVPGENIGKTPPEGDLF